MRGLGQAAQRGLLWFLDVSLAIVLLLGAKIRRIQPTKRSNLTSRPEVRDKLLSPQRNKCVYCSTPISVQRDNYEIDHKTPLARQGTDSVENLQALCRSCNKEKSARTHAEYQHYRRYGRDRASYLQFRGTPKYLKPMEVFWKLAPVIIGALTVAGLVIGSLTVEQPIWGAVAFGIPAVGWAVGAYVRGKKTGAFMEQTRG